MTNKIYGSILISALLVGCASNNAPSQDVAADQIYISGMVYYEEPVGGVEVCADLNETFSCSSSDPTTTTHPDGTYELNWETKFPEQDYVLLVTWPNDLSSTITTTLHHELQLTKMGARSEHGGVINPLTTEELSVYRQLQRVNPDQTDYSGELAELRETYADIYQLPAENIYTDVMNAQDYIDITAIHDWMTIFTFYSKVNAPLAPAKVTQVLKNEYLNRLKTEGISIEEMFIPEQRQHTEKIQQALIELGFLSGDE